MTKIITTVGTSIFENFKNRHSGNTSFSNTYKNIADKPNPFKKWNYVNEDEVDEDIPKKRKFLADEIKKKADFWNSINASAEIRSIIEICNQKKEAEFEVHLIATDTVLSVLAADLVCEWFNRTDNKEKPENLKNCLFVKPQSPEHFKEQGNELFVIKDLRVDNKATFEKGFMNLVEVLNKLIDKNTILNITGGYKAIIPIVTLLGQIKEVPLKYIYNDSDLKNNENPLIEVGNLPFSFDWAKAERYYLLLKEGKEYFTNNEQKNNEDAKELIEECELLGLIKRRQITQIGKIFINYVDEYIDISKNSLGFFMEYKLLEYFQFFDENTKYQKISHSVQIVPFPEDATDLPVGNEIDILIEEDGSIFNEIIQNAPRSSKPTEGKYITIEAKPLMGLRDEQFNKMLERIKQYWTKPKEIRLVVYSFLPDSFALRKFEKTDFKNYADLINRDSFFFDVILKIQFVNINISFAKKDITNLLMKHPLKKEFFLDEKEYKNGNLII